MTMTTKMEAKKKKLCRICGCADHGALPCEGCGASVICYCGHPGHWSLQYLNAAKVEE
jgi:hypothetical protein